MRILLLLPFLFCGCATTNPTWWVRSLPSMIEEVCLDGHVYYTALYEFSGAATAVLAAKLDDDGKPVLCKKGE